VAISIVGSRPTTLGIETREWDISVTEFIADLPR
jgi:hypothetical protein